MRLIIRRMATFEPLAGPKLKNSLFFSLLAGNLAGETGSTWTASATTQSPESLITETLREQAALARPVRHVIFGIWSPAGEAGQNLGLVSSRKNPVPGAVMPIEQRAYGASPSLANCRDHAAGASRRFAMPTPRGRRPSTAACTRFGARNASDIVILI